MYQFLFALTLFVFGSIHHACWSASLLDAPSTWDPQSQLEWTKAHCRWRSIKGDFGGMSAGEASTKPECFDLARYALIYVDHDLDTPEAMKQIYRGDMLVIYVDPFYSTEICHLKPRRRPYDIFEQDEVTQAFGDPKALESFRQKLDRNILVECAMF